MRTTKPIATISFNTPEYLRTKLEELTKAGRISFWTFIVHKPEDDEGGKKQHSHLYVEPSRMLQTDDLRRELMEYDPTHPDKPLGTLTWVSSRFDPWYLYALHDRRFLSQKGQSRRFHYSHDDLISSDSDDLLAKSRSIDMLSLSPYSDMEEAMKQGLSWPEYFGRGTVPIPQVIVFQKAWELLRAAQTYRNDRPNHELDIDPETGEILNDE